MLKKFIVYFIGNIGSRIFSFLMVPLYTSLLLPSEFGIYDYWGTVVGLVATIVGMEVFRSSYTEMLRNKDDKKKQKQTLMIAIHFLASQWLIVGLIGLALFLFVPEYALFIAFIIALSITIEFFGSISRGTENNKIMASAGVVQTFTMLSATIVLLYLKPLGLDNVASLFLGQIIGMILTVVYYLIMLGRSSVFKELPWQFFSKSSYTKLLAFSLPLVPSSISWWIMNVSDRFIIINYLSEASNGIYAMAYKFPSLLMIINSILMLVWQDEAILTNEDENKGAYYSKQLKRYTIVQLIALVCFTVGFKFIAPIMLQSSFIEAEQYVPILGFSVVFSGLASFYGSFYLSTGRTKGAFATSIYGAIVNVVVNLVFIQSFGLYAAAISTVLSFAVMVFIRVFEFKKELNIKFPVKEMALGTITFLICYCFFYF